MKYTVTGSFLGMNETWEEDADDESELAFVMNKVNNNDCCVDITVTDEDGNELDSEEIEKIVLKAEADRPVKLRDILDLLDSDVEIDLTVSVCGQAADSATGTKNDEAISDYGDCGVDSMDVVDDTLVITVVTTYDD